MTPAPGPQEPLLAFLHVPKTAGTSMRLLLWEAFGRDRVFWHGEGEDGFLEDAVTKKGTASFDRYTVIGGHIPFSNHHLHALPRKKIFAAVVRRPAEQLVSHFAFVSKQPAHPLHAGTTLERALTTDTRFLHESVNMQCRYVTNRPTASEALEVIARTPFILGCFDRLDLFVDRVAQAFDIPKRPLPMENVQEAGYFDQHITPRASAVIQTITAEDEVLYQRVCREGVLTNVGA